VIAIDKVPDVNPDFKPGMNDEKRNPRMFISFQVLPGTREQRVSPFMI
jgi:hypothetical protein